MWWSCLLSCTYMYSTASTTNESQPASPCPFPPSYERFYNQESFWKPYFALLPESFPHLPSTYTGVDAALLAQSDTMMFLLSKVWSRSTH